MIFLTLGAITFANYEIPERLNFGGLQALSVKKLVGGQRVIDAMGPDDDDIAWSGLFFESVATFRAQYLDQMRRLGTAIPLTWGQFNYLVVIKDFKANFERTYQIPYSITVTVIQDLNSPITILVPVAYNDAILGMLAEANDLAFFIANPSVLSAMTLLSAAINNVPDFNVATSTQIATIISPLAAAQSAVLTAINGLQSASAFL